MNRIYLDYESIPSTHNHSYLIKMTWLNSFADLRNRELYCYSDKPNDQKAVGDFVMYRFGVTPDVLKSLTIENL